MFGQHHDGNPQHGQAATPPAVSDDGTLGITPPDSSSASVSSQSDSTTPLPQTFRQSASPDEPAASLPEATSDVPADNPQPETLSLSASSPEPSDSSDSSPLPSGRMSNTPNDLIGIKQEALQMLKPLVGHLDQTPEEKFRTTMMMIQAADDQSLIAEAYEAAKAITDEKVQAQALLDVVNEINYFASQSQSNQ